MNKDEYEFYKPKKKKKHSPYVGNNFPNLLTGKKLSTKTTSRILTDGDKLRESPK